MQRAAEIAVSFSHTRPNGSRCFTAYEDLGYSRSSYYGENIAAGSTSASPVFELWQESSENYAGQGHRRNMLNGKYQYVGVACVVRNGTYYWVQEFSSQPTGKSSTTADDSSATATVEVLDSAVTVSSMSADPASIDLKPGQSASLPKVVATISLTDTYHDPVTVTIPVSDSSWTSSSTNVAAASGSSVVAKGLGSATLSTQALGATASTTVTVAHDISDANVTLSSTSFTYDGTAKTPSVTVTLDGASLSSESDYSLSYKDNTDAGTATVTVTGEGNYTGTATATFEITKAASKDDGQKADDGSKTDSGSRTDSGSKTDRSKTTPDTPTPSNPGNTTSIPMYRLYNPWSGEHLFTTDTSEYEYLATLGWHQEGVT